MPVSRVLSAEGMASIYLSVNGREELIKILPSMSSKEVKDLFIAASGENDADGPIACKLTNNEGSLIPISPSMSANTPSTRYTLDIIKNCMSDLKFLFVTRHGRAAGL